MVCHVYPQQEADPIILLEGNRPQKSTDISNGLKGYVIIVLKRPKSYLTYGLNWGIDIMYFCQENVMIQF